MTCELLANADLDDIAGGEYSDEGAADSYMDKMIAEYATGKGPGVAGVNTSQRAPAVGG